MFILGTSSVLAFVGGQPINVIGPIPQTMRAAFGSTGVGAWAGPFAMLARAIATASLIFTGLTRLPMTAGWDHLTPDWFTRLDARRGTPVNSILFVAALAGLLSSIVSLAIAVYPIVDVTSRMEYVAKICAVVLVANGLGVVIYRAGRAKAEHTAK
jgi:amino acid transporter